MKDGNDTRAEGGEVEGESDVEAGNVNGGNNNQNMTSDEGRATGRHMQSRVKKEIPFWERDEGRGGFMGTI